MGYELGIIEGIIALVTVIITFTKVIADVSNLKNICDKHDTLIIGNIKDISTLQNTTSSISSLEKKIDAYFTKMDNLSDKYVTKDTFDRYESTIEKSLDDIKHMIEKINT